jgi:hypothetical protein
MMEFMSTDPAKRAERPSGEPLEDQHRRLTLMLDRGIASIRAGKIIETDEYRRIIDEALAERAAERAKKHLR